MGEKFQEIRRRGRKMTLTDEEKVKEALRHLDKLAKMMRYDQKRKKYKKHQAAASVVNSIIVLQKV